MREDLESRLLKEAALREVEKRRLRELEEVKRELQRLLEEERQAKRDEEIVRQLQARYKIIHLKNSCFWLKTGNICAFTITCVSVYYKIIDIAVLCALTLIYVYYNNKRTCTVTRQYKDEECMSPRKGRKM